MIKFDDYKKVELWPYQCFIDKLIYFACDIKPNIAFIIKQLSKDNTNLRKSYLQLTKRRIQYLKEIIQLGLVYDKKSDKTSPINPPSYCFLYYGKNNFIGYLKNQKSVIKHYFILIQQSFCGVVKSKK